MYYICIYTYEYIYTYTHTRTGLVGVAINGVPIVHRHVIHLEAAPAEERVLPSDEVRNGGREGKGEGGEREEGGEEGEEGGERELAEEIAEEEVSSLTLVFDACGGHVDHQHRYHYHLIPVCVLRALNAPTPARHNWWLSAHPEAQWPARAPRNAQVCRVAENAEVEIVGVRVCIGWCTLKRNGLLCVPCNAQVYRVGENMWVEICG